MCYKSLLFFTLSTVLPTANYTDQSLHNCTIKTLISSKNSIHHTIPNNDVYDRSKLFTSWRLFVTMAHFSTVLQFSQQIHTYNRIMLKYYLCTHSAILVHFSPHSPVVLFLQAVQQKSFQSYNDTYSFQSAVSKHS